ncbi:unnamed protein product, partial [Candidula unifasciata]
MDFASICVILSIELLVACLVISAEDTKEGHWGSWGAMSPCSVTCGLGTTSMERVWIPGPNDPPSKDPYTSTQTFPCTHEIFPDCPQDGIWSVWMGWSRCTKACGIGLMSRQRECRGQFFGGKPCEGSAYEQKECNEQPCPPLPKHFNMTQCRDWHNFTCISQKMCVPVTQKCDTVVQCHDGSDEIDCLDISLMRGGNVRYDLRMWRN